MSHPTKFRRGDAIKKTKGGREGGGVTIIITASSFPGSRGAGGGGYTSREWRHLGPSPSRETDTREKDTKNQKMPVSGAHTGRERNVHICAEGPVTG